MESNFSKLSSNEKAQILELYKLDFHKKETFDTYEYLILSLK